MSLDLSDPVTHAILSGYLSIAAGIVEAGYSYLAGQSEVSMALYGIALTAILDTSGSILVLVIWQCSPNDRPLQLELKELKYTIIIGCFMMFLGIFFVIDCVRGLALRTTPHRTVMSELGDSTALFGAVASSTLCVYKYYVGKKLGSPAIVADAVSTLCSALTSLVAFLVTFSDTWWLDGVTGLCVAFFTLYNGTSTLIYTNRDLATLQESLHTTKKTARTMYADDNGGYQEYDGYSSTGSRISYHSQSDIDSGRSAVDDSGEESIHHMLVDSSRSHFRATPVNTNDNSRHGFGPLRTLNVLYERFNRRFFSSSSTGGNGTHAMEYNKIPSAEGGAISSDSDEENYDDNII